MVFGGMWLYKNLTASSQGGNVPFIARGKENKIAENVANTQQIR